MEATDVCFAPVLSMSEAPDHPHNRARGTFVEVDGMTQPAPAPRYSATPTARPRMASEPGADGELVLDDLGYSSERTAALRCAGIVG